MPHDSTSPSADHNSEQTRPSEQSSLAAFVRSAVYSAAEEPLRGVAQLSDHLAGTHLDEKIQDGFKSVGVYEAPQARFGSGTWAAQQLGSALGSMVPFMLTRGAVRGLAGRALGEETLFSSPAASSLLKQGTVEGAVSGVSGFVDGALLRPAQEQGGSTSFGHERLYNGLATGALFTSVGFTAPYAARALGGAGYALERSALPAAVSRPAGMLLTNPMTTGALASAPGGVLGAEINARRRGEDYASWKELKESVAGGMFVGGAFGAAQWASTQRAGTDVTNARHYTDKIGLTRSNADNQTRGFKVVGDATPVQNLHADVAKGLAEAQALVQVRPRVRGVMSAFTGDKLAGLGNVQSLLLNHGDPARINAALASRADLIATCENLPASFKGRDVFQARTTGDGAPGVWLTPRSANGKNFSLALSETPPESRGLQPVPLGAIARKFNFEFPKISSLFSKKNQPEPHGHGLVIGAGGAKIYEAIGALMAMEELKVPINSYTGVSAGGDTAAALANGMRAKDLLRMTLDARPQMWNPFKALESIQIPTWEDLSISRSWLSLEKAWREPVERMGWKPNDRLRLVAATKNPETGEWDQYIFQGTDYNLATGLGATGALPDWFAPVRVGDTRLVDGGLNHFNPVLPPMPGDKGPPIVIRLGRVEEMPKRLQFPQIAFNPISPDGLPSWFERGLYLREMYPPHPINNAVDTQKAVLIDLHTDTPGLNLWVSRQHALQMVKHGYHQAMPQLRRAILEGRIQSDDPTWVRTMFGGAASAQERTAVH